MPGLTSELCAPRRIVPPRSELALRFWIAAVAVLPLVDQRDHRVRRRGVELGAVGVGQAGHVARVFDRRHLHAQADAEVGHAVLARVLRGDDLAFDAALAEAAGHQDRVEARQLARRLSASASRSRRTRSRPRAWLWMPAWRSASLSDLYAVRQVGVLAAHRDRDARAAGARPRAPACPSAAGRPAWSAAAASCRSARPGPARAACAAPCRWCRRPAC